MGAGIVAKLRLLHSTVFQAWDRGARGFAKGWELCS